MDKINGKEMTENEKTEPVTSEPIKSNEKNQTEISRSKETKSNQAASDKSSQIPPDNSQLDQSKVVDSCEVSENVGNHSEEKSPYIFDKNIIYKLSEGYILESQFWLNMREICFVEEIPAEFLCDHCHFVAWYSIQLSCGHHICKSCRIQVNETEKETIFNCPIDKKTVKISEAQILDSEQKNISEFLVYCREPECAWKGSFSELENHCKECDFRINTCFRCNEKIQMKNFLNHMENLCPLRQLTCPYCKISIIYTEEESHDRICPEKLIECPNQCKTEEDKTKIVTMKQGNLKNHLENECYKRIVDCIFKDFKCPKQCKFRTMPKHIIKYSIIHLNDMCASSRSDTDVLLDQIRILLNLQEKIKMNEKKLIDISTRVGPQLLWKITNIKEKYQAALGGEMEDIKSLSFYSSNPYGYKFIARFVLSVNSGNSDSHFISIFVSICDNPYNNLLTWPFKQKIQIHMINLKSDRHISHTLVPNSVKENYPFVQKPEMERNPYFGVERFAKCNTLYDGSPFVEDNSIFIKINIEPHDVA